MGIYDDFSKKINDSDQNAELESNDISTTSDLVEIADSNDNPPPKRQFEVYEKVHVPIYKKKEYIYLAGTFFLMVIFLGAILYKPSAKIPDFANKSVAIVEEWAKANSIVVSKKEEFSKTIAKNSVISQELKADTRIVKGDVFTITVSRGPDVKEKIKLFDFKGKSKADIEKWIADNQLVNTKIEEVSNEAVAKGKYIRYEMGTTPDAFTRGTELKVLVSKGSILDIKETSMPEYIGKPFTDAYNWSIQNKYDIKKVDVFDDLAEVGTIVDQDVKAGAVIKRDRVVTFKVSKGAGVKVPNIIGMACGEINTNDVAFNLVERYSNSVRAGFVMDQSKSAGEKVAEGAQVTGYCSLGKVKMQSFIGMGYSELLSYIDEQNAKGANLSVRKNWVKGDGEQASGTIVKQNLHSDAIDINSTIVADVVR